MNGLRLASRHLLQQYSTLCRLPREQAETHRRKQTYFTAREGAVRWLNTVTFVKGLHYNNTLTLNCHSNECYWPRTLEWGWTAQQPELIHYNTKFPFSCPTPTSTTPLSYYMYTMNYIHRLLTNLSFLLNTTKLCHKYYYEEKHQSIRRKNSL